MVLIRSIMRLIALSVMIGTLSGVMAAFLVMILWPITALFPYPITEFDRLGPGSAIYMTSWATLDPISVTLDHVSGVSLFRSGQVVSTVKAGGAA